MKIKSSVLFLLSSVFLVSCDVWAAEDPLAGKPEGERIALSYDRRGGITWLFQAEKTQL